LVGSVRNSRKHKLHYERNKALIQKKKAIYRVNKKNKLVDLEPLTISKEHEHAKSLFTIHNEKQNELAQNKSIMKRRVAKNSLTNKK
jgi:hypothetical protein